MSETLTNLPAVYVSLEDSKKQELKKLNPLEVRLSELKAKHKGKTIKDENDKEGYLACKEAASDFRSFRTGAEDDRKEHKEYFLEMGRAIDGGYGKITSEAKLEEENYKAFVKKWDEQKEKEKTEKKRKQDAALFNRQLQLTKMGAQFDGANFVLEGAEVNMALVREVDDDTYEEQILPQFKEIFDRNEAIRIAEEDKKKEADRILKEQQDELQRQQEAVKKQQEELERKQNEIKEKEEAAAKKKKNERISYLYNLGMRMNTQEGAFEFADLMIGEEAVSNLDDKKWDLTMTTLSADIQKIKEKKRIEAEENLEKEKQKAIQDALDKHKKEQEEAQAAKARQDELDRLRKEEELAVSSDDVKWKSFLSLLPVGVGNLEFKSRKYRTKAAIAVEKLQEIKAL